MSWIKSLAYERANARLKKIYDDVKQNDSELDNIVLVHSLRPHTLTGHFSLYKNVLHHSANELPKWYLEAVGVYVSYLNKCFYCVQHHFTGMKKLLGDENKSEQILISMQEDNLQNSFEGKFLAGFLYAEKLTATPSDISENDIQQLRDEGFSDGEILEVNQVVSYFNYANRVVLGLGVHLENDKVDAKNPVV